MLACVRVYLKSSLIMKGTRIATKTPVSEMMIGIRIRFISFWRSETTAAKYGKLMQCLASPTKEREKMYFRIVVILIAILVVEVVVKASPQKMFVHP